MKEIVKEVITDWFLPESDPSSGWVYPGGKKIKDDPVLILAANELGELCSKKNTSEFVLKTERGEVFRGHRIDTVDGRVFTLRKMPMKVPSLDHLGMDPGVVQLLLAPQWSAGGLIILAGETGQGKSTSCASLIKSRLELFGSFCLTIEDPPELPLNGFHGKKNGVCIQTDVKSGNFGEALKGAVRCYPTQGNSLLFIGEVRDPETAAEMLRAAMNGHLVISSIHGLDVISSLRRLISLASAFPKMGELEAQSICASVFKMLVHQKLKEKESQGRSLETQVVVSSRPTSTVANCIKDGRLELISTSIQLQDQLLKLKKWNNILNE